MKEHLMEAEFLEAYTDIDLSAKPYIVAKTVQSLLLLSTGKRLQHFAY